MMKKILIISFSLILIVAIFIFASVFATGPSLPDVTDSIINDVMNSEPDDKLPGETGFADASGFRIWYKAVKSAGVPRGDILLISGIAADS